MAKTTRRTLLVTGSAPAAVAEAYARYLVVGRNTFPTTPAAETWEQSERAHDTALEIWFPAHEGAVLRLAEARSTSVADLGIKLQLVCDFLEANGQTDGNTTDQLLLSCLRDLRAMQG